MKSFKCLLAKFRMIYIVLVAAKVQEEGLSRDKVVDAHRLLRGVNHTFWPQLR